MITHNLVCAHHRHSQKQAHPSPDIQAQKMTSLSSDSAEGTAVEELADPFPPGKGDFVSGGDCVLLDIVIDSRAK